MVHFQKFLFKTVIFTYLRIIFTYFTKNKTSSFIIRGTTINLIGYKSVEYQPFQYFCRTINVFQFMIKKYSCRNLGLQINNLLPICYLIPT